MDGDCSHEIRKCLLLGRKAMTHLDSVLKSGDITLLMKVRIIKAMVFPVVTYSCEKVKVIQSSTTLCNPMDCSMPGLPVPHHLLKSAQVHVHCIGDAIQPSHPLMPSSSLAFNLSLHQTFPMSHLFASDDQNTGASASASVLPVNIQGWFPLRLTGFISLLSKGLSGVFSRATVQRHQFFDTLPSLWPSSHNSTWPLGRPEPWHFTLGSMYMSIPISQFTPLPLLTMLDALSLCLHL